MKRHIRPVFLRILISGLLLAVPFVSPPPARGEAEAGPVRVVASVPDLGDLAREVGGEDVRVTVLARGGDDPHALEARPSFIRDARDAELFVQVGLDHEIGWAPLIVRKSTNPKIQPGQPGFLDASTLIEPRGLPEGPVDRSMGDVHAAGNPHYLLDPIAGLAIARALADRFATLRPHRSEAFQKRFDRFRARLGEAMVGKALAAEYAFEKLARLHEHGRLGEFLDAHGLRDELGGWLGTLLPHAGVRVVADHDLWPYFAARFGIEVTGFMEPVPGMPPTTRHLGRLVRRMKQQEIRLILAAPFFDPRHASFLARHTGAAIVPMAHQVESRPGTGTYLGMVDHNVTRLHKAIEQVK